MQILRNALKIAFWIIRIIVPVSLVVTLLSHWGIIAWIATYTQPAFQLIGIRGEGAIAFLTSIFLPLYAAIGVIESLELTLRETTILALMCLISHNLPIECSVQRKVGSPIWQTVLIRLTCSILGAILLNTLLPDTSNVQYTMHDAQIQTQQILPLQDTLINWLTNTASLCLKIIIIITALMFLQHLLKHYGIIDRLARLLSPFMRLCGLHPNSAFLWLIAQVVGLTYGAGIMLQEVEEANTDRNELHRLNLHMSVNHSLIEDTAIFCLLGIAWWWLVVPRFLFAITIVHLHNLIRNKE